jgi:acid phosphatase family membrane protein YuiD
MVIDILDNFFPLIASISAMVLSQTIKLIIMLLSGNKVNLVSLTRSGGMPSSHSALITAITLSIGLKNGVNSSHFFLAVALSLVVIYDARGIRHTVGKHAKILNQNVLHHRDPKLNEHTGHTFPEIIAGICIGIIISLAMYNMIGL